MAPIGIDDNFFEVGGHSLLLLRAHDELQRHFDTKVSIVDLFQYPTIRVLAEYLQQENHAVFSFAESKKYTQKRKTSLERYQKRRKSDNMSF